MLVAGRGCGLAHSTVPISQYSARLVVLTAHRISARSAPRKGWRVSFLHNSRHRSGKASTDDDATTAVENAKARPKDLIHEKSNRNSKTRAGASRLSQSNKDSSKLAWLQYQNVLHIRAGLPRWKQERGAVTDGVRQGRGSKRGIHATPTRSGLNASTKPSDTSVTADVGSTASAGTGRGNKSSGEIQMASIVAEEKLDVARSRDESIAMGSASTFSWNMSEHNEMLPFLRSHETINDSDAQFVLPPDVVLGAAQQAKRTGHLTGTEWQLEDGKGRNMGMGGSLEGSQEGDRLATSESDAARHRFGGTSEAPELNAQHMRRHPNTLSVSGSLDVGEGGPSRSHDGEERQMINYISEGGVGGGLRPRLSGHRALGRMFSTGRGEGTENSDHRRARPFAPAPGIVTEHREKSLADEECVRVSKEGHRRGARSVPLGARRPRPQRPSRGRENVEGRSSGGSANDRGDAASTASHSREPGSVWTNVHGRKNLSSLLRGLPSDLSVRKGLRDHHLPTEIHSKVIWKFSNLAIKDPDTAFPGEDGQRIQRAISELCFREKFNVKPSKWAPTAKGTTGRMDTNGPVAPGPNGSRASFDAARSKLVDTVFIPRLVELAHEDFPEEMKNSKRTAQITDLRDPHRWYPLARLKKRRIIYHGGPTNSGKTYTAIERLKTAGANRQPGDGPAGIFCGPLRLLALEVYEQLNSQGIYCSLMTGQERREVPFATHVSCTIEMASTTNEYEVAVIDEIQMLADEQRGSSWTAALLGLNCPEIHVCGGIEGADLVETLAKEMGDDFELREYQRKTELVCAEESLNSDYKHVQPGDAIVAFSRRDIFSIKKEVERKTDHKCCIIYGSLPQETRAHQARLFNTEGTDYDILVASDAIGMGLNLNIRRVIFHSVSKRGNGGRANVMLPYTMVKQIGGRAGRHGKQWEFGEVTSLKPADLPYIKRVMNTPLKPLPKAGIFPSVDRTQEFSDHLDEIATESQQRRRLAETYAAFAASAKIGHRFFLGTYEDNRTLANALHPIENLTIKERCTISMAPVSSRNALLVRAVTMFAKAHAAGVPVFINMQLPPKGVMPASMHDFQALCSKHSVLDLYKWMGIRFPAIECFAEKSVAEIQRKELEVMINTALQRSIAVNGPNVAANHDSFDVRVLRALNSPTPLVLGDGAATEGQD